MPAFRVRTYLSVVVEMKSWKYLGTTCALTNELFVPLIYGEISESGCHCTNHPVHLHSEELHEYGESLFFSHSRSHVNAGLPIAGGEILNGTCRSF